MSHPPEPIEQEDPDLKDPNLVPVGTPTLTVDGLQIQTRWARLVEIHNQAKSIALLAEEFDPDSKLFFQPAMELRHALEHVIRAQAVLAGMGGKDTDGDYVLHSFDKAIGHEYRAFFDAADWLSVSIRQRITKTLARFSNRCVDAVLPDYYKQLRPEIDQICRKIAEIRGAKDIARNTNSDIDDKIGKSAEAIEEVDKYRDVIARLTAIAERIQDSTPALLDWRRKNLCSALLKWVLGALIGGIISAIFTAWVLIYLGLAKP